MKTTKPEKTVTLAVTLTAAQFKRLEVIAGLLSSTPENVLVGLTFADLEACALGGWADWEDGFAHGIELYAEQGVAHESNDPKIEDTAPARRLRLVTAHLKENDRRRPRALKLAS